MSLLLLFSAFLLMMLFCFQLYGYIYIYVVVIFRFITSLFVDSGRSAFRWGRGFSLWRISKRYHKDAHLVEVVDFCYGFSAGEVQRRGIDN